MDNREKKWFIIMIVLVVLLMVKSIILDPYKPSNDKEQAFFDEVETILILNDTSFIYDYKIVTSRIVKLKAMSERERTVKGKDGETYQATGIYKAKVRKYVFGIIPFSDKYILDID